MKVQAIIPAAGTGTRLNANLPKPLVKVNDKEIFVRTLEVVEQCALIDSIILVVQKEQLEEVHRIVEHNCFKKILKIVAGGQTRFESVNNGLKEVEADTQIVLIHDGARPLVTVEMIEASVKACVSYDAVVVAVPSKSTIKRVNSTDLTVKETLNRQELWEVQTPQVFKKEILFKAHASAKDNESTDDAVLVEQLGIGVHVLKGDYRNIKITTPEDLRVAELFLTV